MLNLQSVLLAVEKDGFKTKWVPGGLLVEEQRRIVKHIDGRCTIYGVSYEEMKSLSLVEQWGMSIVLGGPPFWTTSNFKVAFQAARKLGIMIHEDTDTSSSS